MEQPDQGMTHAELVEFCKRYLPPENTRHDDYLPLNKWDETLDE